MLLLLLLGLSFRPPLSLNQNCTTAKSKLDAKDADLTGLTTDEMKIILQKDPKKNPEKKRERKIQRKLSFYGFAPTSVTRFV